MAEKKPKAEEPKNPKITKVKSDHLPDHPKAAGLPQPVSQDEIQVLFSTLRQLKRPLSSAPTNTPQNLLQQFEIYENGSTRRLYFYVTDTWRYTTLT